MGLCSFIKPLAKSADRSELMILALPAGVPAPHRQLTHRNWGKQLGGSRHHSQPTLHKQAGLLKGIEFLVSSRRERQRAEGRKGLGQFGGLVPRRAEQIVFVWCLFAGLSLSDNAMAGFAYPYVKENQNPCFQTEAGGHLHPHMFPLPKPAIKKKCATCCSAVKPHYSR